ncbi:MAG: sulfotransferase [Verrucomicrobiota bacterium]
MKRPQLVSQGSLNRMIQAADECCKRGDLQQGIEIIERTTRLDPANWRLRLQLGRAHGFNYDYAAAERCLEQAVRFAPHKTEALAAAGKTSIEFGRPQMAEGYFRRAVEQRDATAETIARLAALYERTHRMEEAAVLVERALHLDNACPLARLTRAKLHRQAGRLVEAEQALRPMLTAADRESRVLGWYELGGIYDRQGRYDEAMTAYLEAKALLLPDAPPLLTQLQPTIRHLQEMQNNISAELLQRWFDSGRELQTAHRLAFLGGHPRSGTTLLEQVLDSHPDTVSAAETRVFTDEALVLLTRGLPQGTPMLAALDGASVKSLGQARERYFHLMELFLDQPIGDRLLIDKNPDFQSLIPAFVRFFPEIKLLVAIRDPRDAVLSCFMQPLWPLSTGNATFLNLEGTVGTYTRVMGIWLTLKPLVKNPFLEVRYEDMVDDLESVARKTLDFLGVPWDARVMKFDEHARQKVVRSPTYSDVTKPVYKGAVGRWRNYQKYLEPHLEKLEPVVKAFGYE